MHPLVLLAAFPEQRSEEIELVHHHLRDCAQTAKRIKGAASRLPGRPPANSSRSTMRSTRTSQNQTTPNRPPPHPTSTNEEQEKSKGRHGGGRQRRAPPARGAGGIGIPARGTEPNQADNNGVAVAPALSGRGAGRRAPRYATRTHGTPGPACRPVTVRSPRFLFLSRSHAVLLSVSGRGGAQAIRVACRRSPAHVGGRKLSRPSSVAAQRAPSRLAAGATRGAADTGEGGPFDRPPSAAQASRLGIVSRVHRRSRRLGHMIALLNCDASLD